MGATLFYIVDSHFNDFMKNQQAIADQSLTLTAVEIENHIAHKRHLARILVEDRTK